MRNNARKIRGLIPSFFVNRRKNIPYSEENIDKILIMRRCLIMKKVLGVVRIMVKCVVNKEELRRFEQEMGA